MILALNYSLEDPWLFIRNTIQIPNMPNVQYQILNDQICLRKDYFYSFFHNPNRPDAPFFRTNLSFQAIYMIMYLGL